MSTITTSRPRACAASIASYATAAGSPPRSEPTKSAPARFAQISSCSSAAARNVSAAATTTEWPCSASFDASLPIVVVLPVPLTPTTRITLGAPSTCRMRRLAEERRDLLCERCVQVAELAARLEPPHELRRRGHADVALDQRLLEPLPVRRVARVERRGRDLADERAPRLRERVAQPREHAGLLLLALGSRIGLAEKLSPAPRHARERSYAAETASASSRGRRRETICEMPSPPIVTP